jgi:hypothetical protein
LSQKGFSTGLEYFGGARFFLGTSTLLLERKTENVPEQPEMLWLLFAEENHSSRNVSERIQNYLGGYWKCSGPT